MPRLGDADQDAGGFKERDVVEESAGFPDSPGQRVEDFTRMDQFPDQFARVDRPLERRQQGEQPLPVPAIGELPEGLAQWQELRFRETREAGRKGDEETEWPRLVLPVFRQMEDYAAYHVPEGVAIIQIVLDVSARPRGLSPGVVLQRRPEIFQDRGTQLLQPPERGSGFDDLEELLRGRGGRGGVGRFRFHARDPAELGETAARKIAPEREVGREGRGQLRGGEVEESGGSPLVKGIPDPCGDRLGKRGAVPAVGQEKDLPRGGQGQCGNRHGRRSGLSGFSKRREYRKTTATSQG
jgi:hypothetical protein